MTSVPVIGMMEKEVWRDGREESWVLTNKMPFRNKDGEIIGTAIEGAMNVQLTVDLIKGRETPWPRIENSDWMMSLGAARPLEDAARIAFKDMVQWVMEKTGLSMLDAYQFVSQNALAPVIEIVDPLYTVLVKIPKRRLPAPAR